MELNWLRVPYQAPLLLSLSLSEKSADSCLAVLLLPAFFLPRGRSWVYENRFNAGVQVSCISRAGVPSTISQSC